MGVFLSSQYAMVSAFLACMGVAIVSALVTFIYTDLVSLLIVTTLPSGCYNNSMNLLHSTL